MGKLTTPPRLMRGATAGTAGASGYVPPPAAGDQDKPFHGDGTYRAVSNASAATNAQASEATSTTTFLTPANALFAASTLFNLRPPRPGVYFDRTASSGVEALLTNQNIATDAFSVVQGLVPNATAPASNDVYWVLGQTSGGGGSANLITMRGESGGQLRVLIFGASGSDFNRWTFPGWYTSYGGRAVNVAVIRNASGDPTIRFNGVDVTSQGTFDSGGSAPTWQGSITSTYLNVGRAGTTSSTAAYLFATLYNLALSQTDAEEIYFNGGRVPFRYQWGTQVAPLSPTVQNGGFETAGGGGADVFADWTENANYTTTQATDARPGSAGTKSARLQHTSAGGVAPGGTFSTSAVTFSAGKTYQISLWYKDASSTRRAWLIPRVGSSATSTAIPAPADANWNLVEQTVTTTATGSLAFLRDGGVPFTAGDTIDVYIDDITVKPLGAVVHLPMDEGIGYQLHDASSNKLDAIMTTTGVHHLIAKREGYVRGTLTWTGTHESKSLLGQRAFPRGTVVTLLTRRASASSAGSGCTIGATNDLTRWQAISTFSTAKAVSTLANQQAVNDTDAHNDIVVDPDTTNFTGSIEVEARYAVTESYPGI